MPHSRIPPDVAAAIAPSEMRQRASFVVSRSPGQATEILEAAELARMLERIADIEAVWERAPGQKLLAKRKTDAP